jgi:hypothetical protein
MFHKIWDYIANNRKVWLAIGFLLLTYFFYVPAFRTIQALIVCDTETNAYIVNIKSHPRSIRSTVYSYIVDNTKYIIEENGSWGMRKGNYELLKYYSKKPSISYLPKMVIETVVFKIVFSAFLSWVLISLIFINYQWINKSKNISMSSVYQSNEKRYENKINQFLDQTKKK